jgi:hypothetical protein
LINGHGRVNGNLATVQTTQGNFANRLDNK